MRIVAAIMALLKGWAGNGVTPVHSATEAGDAAAIKALLEAGADPDEIDGGTGA